VHRRRLRAPSPALVISLIALFVALGGTSYAAIHLPKNSVGSKQLKKNAVTSKKIKNGAVTASKINPVGLTVPNATNATHATNADHATSADSAPLPSTLPTGQTERGSFAAIDDISAANQGAASAITWPIPLAADPVVHIIPPSGTPPTGCSGSVSNPQASSGNLCIFVAFKGVPDGTITTLNPEDNQNGEAGRSGAMIYDNATGSSGRNDFWGTFAVTG
jgi:hypothetical protein